MGSTSEIDALLALAKNISPMGALFLVLFGLYKQWWYIKPSVTQLIENEKLKTLAAEKERDAAKAENLVKDIALDAANKELNETKIVYAGLEARYEALEKAARSSSRTRRSPAP